MEAPPNMHPKQQAVRMLIEHLTLKRSLGQQESKLSTEARKVLRHWLQNKGAAPSSSLPSSKNTTATTNNQLEEKPSSPSPQAIQSSPRETILKLTPPKGADPASKIEDLKSQLEQSDILDELPNLRDTLVFSYGDPNSNLMIIDAAPGMEEEKIAQPFAGKSGELLDKIIETMGLSRDELYLSTILKYRPSMPSTTSTENKTRKPSKEEMAAFAPIIHAEIEAISPQAIIALGADAAEGLLGEIGSVGRARRGWHQFANIPVKVTYHPSYLDYNKSKSERRKVWVDMLEVMEKLELPISEKQRNFFS